VARRAHDYLYTFLPGSACHMSPTAVVLFFNCDRLVTKTFTGVPLPFILNDVFIIRNRDWHRSSCLIWQENEQELSAEFKLHHLPILVHLRTILRDSRVSYKQLFSAAKLPIFDITQSHSVDSISGINQVPL